MKLNKELFVWFSCVQIPDIYSSETNKRNEIKRTEGQNVINAVKTFDKSYPPEVHCSILEK